MKCSPMAKAFPGDVRNWLENSDSGNGGARVVKVREKRSHYRGANEQKQRPILSAIDRTTHEVGGANDRSSHVTALMTTWLAIFNPVPAFFVAHDVSSASLIRVKAAVNQVPKL